MVSHNGRPFANSKDNSNKSPPVSDGSLNPKSKHSPTDSVVADDLLDSQIDFEALARKHGRRQSICSRQQRSGSLEQHPLHDAATVQSSSVGNQANRPLSRPVDPVATEAPKMSLFHLFSRPKVEKSRGHSEAGFPSLSASRFTKANVSRNALAVNVHPPVERSPSRAASVMGFRKPDHKRDEQKMKPDDALQRPSMARRNSWNPPPLFQAYPQAIKHGILEVSMSANETVMSKSKGRKGSVQHLASSEPSSRGSMDSYDSSRTRNILKHVASSHLVQIELSRKIFVLVTAGYILQYAETGPSDRLPEKVLQLGQESAAFACDLIPGKHFVLQISQAVNQQGVVVANGGSIFNKLGIRGSSARRMTSNFLLVMPTADDMLSWMEAIRREIEELGGKKVQPEAVPNTYKRRNGSEFTNAEPEPVQNHRFQVKRDPEKVTSLPSPGSPLDTEALQQFPAPPHSSLSTQLPPSLPKVVEDENSSSALQSTSSDEETISGQETERRNSDTPSASSSTGQSVEQQQLNNLRNSTSVKRMSYASMAPTVATSLADSRHNSLKSHTASVAVSPPRPEPKLKQSLDSLRDSGASMSSSHHDPERSLFKRRSAMPMPSTFEINTSRTTNVDDLPSHTVGEGLTALPSPLPLESPVIGKFPEPPSGLSPSATSGVGALRKRISLASPRSMQCLAEVRAKHDSKIGTPPAIHTNDERPESIVGDLPPPSTWGLKTFNCKRSSQQPQSAPGQAQTHNRISLQVTHTGSERLLRKRASTPSFSLPLRVNPSNSTATSPSVPIPNVEDHDAHTNSTEEASTRTLIPTTPEKLEVPSRRQSVSPVSPLSSSPPSAASLPSRTGSARLSLFPTAVSPLQTPQDPLRLSTSNPTPNTTSQQTTLQQLKRPASIQVRTTNAPFLSSMRSALGSQQNNQSQRSTTTAPIRALKPSRSSGNMMTLLEVADSPGDQKRVTTRNSVYEQAQRSNSDASLHSISRSAAASPIPTRVMRSFPAPKGLRGLKVRASLPAIDLVALPPACPPPSAPLPDLPPESRVSSPEPNAFMKSGSITPPKATCSRPPSSAAIARPPSAAGLGIQVGS